MNKKELLKELDDRVWYCVTSDEDLLGLAKFCRDNYDEAMEVEGSCRCSTKECSKKPTGKPPAPKPKHVKALCFQVGDLLVVKGINQEVVYLGYEEIGKLMKTFNLTYKKIVYYTPATLTYPKKKQTVLPTPELVKHLEDNGYKFIESCTGNWGWSNQTLDVPNFFNVEMFKYCGKDPGDHFNWRPEWLTSN